MTERAARPVIIGGGIIGCSIALALARRGQQPIVLDKGPGAGLGSTSASSAVIRFSYSTLDAVKLAWEAASIWREWQQFLGVTDPAGHARFVRTGLLVLDSPVTGVDAVRGHFDALDIPYETFTAPELRERFPWLDAGRYYPPRPVTTDAFWADSKGSLGGYLTPDAGFVDDPALGAHNLMHAARAHGAEFRFRTTLIGIDIVEGRIVGVRLGDGTVLPTDTVVNAAGPYSSVVNRLAGLPEAHVGTRALRQEVHSLRAPVGVAPGDGESVAVSDSDLGTYFRPHFAGELLVGGVEPDCDPLLWVDDPDDYDIRVTAPVWDAQVMRAARRLPGLEVPSRRTGVAALYDVADDWMPVYDRTDIAGYYLAIGTSGHQFKAAPLVGEALAEIITATASGHDHDRDPVALPAPRTGQVIDLGHFSRLRAIHSTTQSVLG